MISKHHMIFSFALIFIFLFSLIIIFGDKGLADLNMQKKTRDSLIEKNHKLSRENMALYRAIGRMNNDLAFIENVARKELGVIDKNEVIFTIEEASLSRHGNKYKK